ncbi:MAG: ribbon-helix-helix protein, CopG family [Acidimicrobiia bacterium]
MARREVLVQLDDELVARLDELAERTEVSRSELLRRAARALLEADEWAQADKRLIEGYTKYPPDPVLLETSRRLAAETVPEW